MRDPTAPTGDDLRLLCHDALSSKCNCLPCYRPDLGKERHPPARGWEQSAGSPDHRVGSSPAQREAVRGFQAEDKGQRGSGGKVKVREMDRASVGAGEVPRILENAAPM